MREGSGQARPCGPFAQSIKEEHRSPTTDRTYRLLLAIIAEAAEPELQAPACARASRPLSSRSLDLNQAKQTNTNGLLPSPEEHAVQIATIAIGSRGDAQPYVALGKGLLNAGHSVRVVTHAPFEELVHGEELDFVSLGGDPGALVESHFQQSSSGERSGRERRGGMIEALAEQMQEITEKSWRASQDADVLLLSTFGFLMGIPIAQKRRIPAFLAYVQPFLPTAKLPPTALLPSAPPWLTALRPHYNRLTWKILDWGFGQMCKRHAERAQQVLNVPTQSVRDMISSLGTSLLFGYSRSFLPQPKDWPTNCHVTGYWFLDTPKAWQPPPVLVDFLGAGPPPVYVGFGSMPDRDPEEMTDLVVSALGRAGQRGILLTGGGAALRTERGSDQIFFLDSIPHNWLFPRVAAVVHHGRRARILGFPRAAGRRSETDFPQASVGGDARGRHPNGSD
jgi:UDP:flavonoid glycosyltransferase YjiC (YdhE family)